MVYPPQLALREASGFLGTIRMYGNAKATSLEEILWCSDGNMAYFFLLLLQYKHVKGKQTRHALIVYKQNTVALPTFSPSTAHAHACCDLLVITRALCRHYLASQLLAGPSTNVSLLGR